MTRLSPFQQLLRTPSPEFMLGGGPRMDYAPTEADEAALREQGLMGHVIGGVEGIANTLDVPGSYVRSLIHGGITGDWSKGPQNITGNEGRVYGSDILTDLGVPQAPETWSGSGEGGWSALLDPQTYANSALKLARGALGLGVDIVTDPLAVINPFGKTAQGLSKIKAAGKAADAASAAAKAGSMAETVAKAHPLDAAGKPALDAIGAFAPQAGTMGTVGKEILAGDRAALTIGHPWWMETLGLAKRNADPLAEFGKGNTAAGRAAAKTAEALVYNPAMQLARGLFDPRMHNTFSAANQRQADELWVNLKNEMGNVQEASRIFGEAYDDISGKVGEIIKHHTNVDDPKFVDELLRGIQTDENLWNAGATLQQSQKLLDYVDSSLRTRMQGAPVPQAIRQELDSLTPRMIDYHSNLKKFEDNAWKLWQSYGGERADLQDLFAAHAFRSVGIMHDKEAGAMRLKRRGYIDTEHDARPEIARNEATRHHPGSEPAINRASRDAPSMGYARVPKDKNALQDWATETSNGNHLGADARLSGLGEEQLAWLELTPDGMKQFAKAAGMNKAESDALAAMAENLEKQTAARDMPWTAADIAQSTGRELRARRLWETQIIDNIRVAHADQLDAAGNWKQTLRDPPPTGSPAGTLGKIIKDPTTNDWQPWVKHIKDGTPDEMLADYEATMARWNPTTDEAKALGEKHPLHKLLRFLDTFGDEKLQRGIYDQNIAKDLTNYVGSLANRTATLRTAHNWLMGKDIVSRGIANGVDLPTAWAQTGLGAKGMEQFIQNHPVYGPEFAQQLQVARDAELNSRLAKNPTFDIHDPANQAAAEARVRPNVMKKFAADIDVHPRAIKGLQAFADLAEVKNNTGNPGAITKALDNISTTWRTLQYNIWPQSHIRDVISRVTNSALDGRASFGDIVGYVPDFIKYLKNVGKDGYQEAEYIKEFLPHFKAYRGPYQTGGSGISPLLTEGSPSSKWYDVTAVPGFFGHGKEKLAAGATVHPLIKAGFEAQRWGDFVGQGAHFAALRKAGYTVEQAAQIVKETHYLTELSPFEKTFLSKIVPFERFSVRNIPHQLMAIASEPGGRTAQVLRGMNETSAQNTQGVYVPEWMRERTVIPWGRNEKGEQGYYANTSLPQSELNDIILGKGVLGSLARTGEKLASKVFPPFLAAVERPWSEEGRELHTGRKIADLEKPLQRLAQQPLTFEGPGDTARSVALALPWLAGHIPGIESILHYATPLGRATSEAERLPGISRHGTWNQFATNTLGLGKVSYYDDAKWRALDEQKAREEFIQKLGARPFTNYHIPGAPTKDRPWATPGSVASRMTPEQIAEIHAEIQRIHGLSAYMKQQSEMKRAADVAASQRTM